MATVNEVFAQMKSKVEANPAKVATLKASYQFDLTGEGGGTYHASFDNGAFDMGEGPAANAGCTVTMAAPDFLSMVEGKLNPTAAFMSGKLKIKGDMGMAMKLQTIIS
jgi:putative sterol carrier protein